jgi:hypothetical protein
MKLNKLKVRVVVQCFVSTVSTTVSCPASLFLCLFLSCFESFRDMLVEILVRSLICKAYPHVPFSIDYRGCSSTKSHHYYLKILKVYTTMTKTWKTKQSNVKSFLSQKAVYSILQSLHRNSILHSSGTLCFIF